MCNCINTKRGHRLKELDSLYQLPFVLLVVAMLLLSIIIFDVHEINCSLL